MPPANLFAIMIRKLHAISKRYLAAFEKPKRLCKYSYLASGHLLASCEPLASVKYQSIKQLHLHSHTMPSFTELLQL